MPIITLPYHNDSTVIFNQLRDLPFACWLDSGKPNSRAGRYDILTALPTQRWVHHNTITDINHYDISGQLQHSQQSTQDPITLLKTACAALNAPQDSLFLPFTGGIITYCSYNLGREQLGVKQQSPDDCQLPDMVAGLYCWAIIQDHQEQQCYLSYLADCDPQLIERVKQQLNTSQQADSTQSSAFSVKPLLSNTNEQRYHQQFATIKDYIHAGDCYQINYSQCFSAPYQGDPYNAYPALRQAMASPFSAFMDLGHNATGKPQAVMSFSPERFLQIQAQQVMTQPIKGTVARDNNPTIDQNNGESLRNSAKNQAENLMIVDLLRNDMGKSCVPGSIKVPTLFELQSFPNVHHLVSSITGVMADHKTSLDVFKDCFPGGSITGAPKKRAMEIIEELENCQRSIYCGSIAYINANGDLDSNITIRTIACNGENLYCWGGGGIVADSQADEEYQESLTKIGRILSVLEKFNS